MRVLGRRHSPPALREEGAAVKAGELREHTCSVRPQRQASSGLNPRTQNTGAKSGTKQARLLLILCFVDLIVSNISGNFRLIR